MKCGVKTKKREVIEVWRKVMEDREDKKAGNKKYIEFSIF